MSEKLRAKLRYASTAPSPEQVEKIKASQKKWHLDLEENLLFSQGKTANCCHVGITLY